MLRIPDPLTRRGLISVRAAALPGLLSALFVALLALPAVAQEALEVLEHRVQPTYTLGEQLDAGTWELRDWEDKLAGYAIETIHHARIPGFSGAPINLLVLIDTQGTFINAEILSHNEPIFVSGLGEAAFHKFVEQYRGLSIRDSLVVGVPYGDKDEASSLVYLDGVTKATASVRIAHETILASAFAVAKAQLGQVSAGPPARPDPAHDEALVWADLVAQGLATRRLVTNAEWQEAFAGTLWEDDDPEALGDRDGAYLDLWVVDIGAPAIARAALAPDSFAEVQEFLTIATHDEPILLIDAGRHGLVTDAFVRNTAPDLISASQDGFPVALRDADLIVELADGVPGEAALILRTDRRLGFDPTREWEIMVKGTRAHGTFRPEIGAASFSARHVTPERFFIRDVPPKPLPPWLEALRGRAVDLGVLAVFLIALTWVLARRMNRLAGMAAYTPVRLGVLAFVIGFVGWWGQGQLTIATPMGLGRALAEGESLAFLLYDPFSLLIWVFVLGSFVWWGRAYFCGWLCPFGAMQEFAHHLGRLLRLPSARLPRPVDRVLVWAKYPVLVALLTAGLFAPALADRLIEVEPFKTAVTTYFLREWYYTLYAVVLLAAAMVMFKPFCRYVCPLGAFMAIGGWLRGRDWIARRAECGTPCQLCRVRCNYRAIRDTGEIDYKECFGCLDCVTIHDDARTCVPLVLAAKRGGL